MSTILQIERLTLHEFQRLLEQTLTQAVEQANAYNPNGTDDSEFYTKVETAKKLKVSLSTRHNWSKSGQLIPQKIGNRVYYARSEVLSKLKAAS